MTILHRRDTAALALLGLTASPAAAQPQPAGQRAPALPCATQLNDIVALGLDGSGTPANHVVVFGQAFRPGDLPRDAALAARLADGRAVPAQADIKARHADGSARHALISLSLPALRSGERAGLVLSRVADARPATPLDAGPLLEGRQASIDITPEGGGTSWRADLVALFRTALQQGGAALWQSGPLAIQARLAVPIPPAAVGGAAQPRLVADVALRADGVLWVAAWIRNDIAMQVAGGVARYGVRLLLDGREAWAARQVHQAQYQALGRARASLRGAAAPPAPMLRHDAAYLAAMGAVPEFDLAAGIDEGLLSRGAQTMAAAEWSAPFAARGLTQYMPTTGGRPEIGPVTLWQAAWLISGDPRAAQLALGQAEAAGAVPWHYWDEANGVWLNIRHYPRLYTEERSRNGRPGDPAALSLSQQFPAPDQVGGWRSDQAHQPDLSTLPYLLTGERWILDNLQAQASASIMGTYPGNRGGRAGLVVVGGQVRGSAWSLRQVDNAAWLSPDGTAEKAYLQEVSEANWRWLVAKIPDWTARQGEAHGWLAPGGGGGTIAPWQQDYFAFVSVAAALRGNPDARTFLTWQENFLVGRFTREAKGFPPRYGTAYSLAVGDPAQVNTIDAPLYPSWARMAAAMVARDLVSPRPFMTEDYNQLALASLAGVANALGSAQAAATFRALQAMRIPGSGLADLQRNPAFAVVPRGVTRAAAPLPSCTPSQTKPSRARPDPERR
ncbi:MAG: hypothetical protein ACKVQR_19930 [Aquabacterium sp.]